MLHTLLEDVMRRMKRLAPVLAASRAVLVFAVAAPAAQAQAVNIDRDNLALQGYDLVSYFTDSTAMPGSAEFTAVHEGAVYRFVSAAHRDAFTTNPARYVPAYGGYCAFGVSRGYKVKIDPEAFLIVDGRLYLNYDKGVQKEWLKDIPGYIAKADQNWPGLKDKPRR